MWYHTISSLGIIPQRYIIPQQHDYYRQPVFRLHNFRIFIGITINNHHNSLQIPHSLHLISNLQSEHQYWAGWFDERRDNLLYSIVAWIKQGGTTWWVVVCMFIISEVYYDNVLGQILTLQKTQRTNVYKDYNGDIMSVYSML